MKKIVLNKCYFIINKEIEFIDNGGKNNSGLLLIYKNIFLPTDEKYIENSVSAYIKKGINGIYLIGKNSNNIEETIDNIIVNQYSQYNNENILEVFTLSEENKKKFNNFVFNYISYAISNKIKYNYVLTDDLENYNYILSIFEKQINFIKEIYN